MIAKSSPWLIFAAASLVTLAALAFQPQAVRVAVDLESQSPSRGQVFYKYLAQEYSEAQSQWFDTQSGRRTYTVELPTLPHEIRLDPSVGPGHLRIHSAAIYFSVSAASVPPAAVRWGMGHGFQGWSAAHGLANVRTSRYVLDADSAGVDPYFEVLVPLRLQATAERWRSYMSLTAFLLFTLAAVIRALRRESHLRTVGVWRKPVTVMVFLLGAVISGSRWLDRAPATSEVTAGPEKGPYDMNLVDHRGRGISGKRGGLRMHLDPFTLYRNAPNQSSAFYATDGEGHRLSAPTRPDAGDDRPVLAILGSSAAFGYGLASDEETLAWQLGILQPQFRTVNAAASGWLSGQDLAEMVHYVDRLRPTQYVIVNGWNDVAISAETPDNRSGFNWSILAEIERKIGDLAVLSGLSDEFDERENKPKDVSPSERTERAIRTYLNNIEKLHAFAAARGASVLVALQPTVFARKAPSAGEIAIISASDEVRDHLLPRYDSLRRAAEAFCRIHKIPMVDLNDAVELQDGTGSMFLDLVHPNALGHGAIARALVKELRRLDVPHDVTRLESR